MTEQELSVLQPGKIISRESKKYGILARWFLLKPIQIEDLNMFGRTEKGYTWLTLKDGDLRFATFCESNTYNAHVVIERE